MCLKSQIKGIKMDKQEKLLDIEYIENRLKEFSQIKTNRLNYTIRKSNREESKSIYISFWFVMLGNKISRQNQLRISDHQTRNLNLLDFVVNPDEILTKNKKKQFMNFLEKGILYALKQNFKFVINNLEKISNKGGNDSVWNFE